MPAFYHDHPDVHALETDVIDARQGAVLLARSPVFPGGGGQLMDRAVLRWSGGSAQVASVDVKPDGVWHMLEGAPEIHGVVQVEIDAAFRQAQCEVHTLAHVVNNLVYTGFGGALLTGAQLAADGTFRIDCDLPGADNEALRALEGPVNDIIRQDIKVSAHFMSRIEAESIAGMFRSRAVAPPPQADGMVRIVEIYGLDRQACGGTHLASTGQSRPVRILKVENKGRINRRIRVGVVATS